MTPEHRYAQNGEVRLHYACAGPADAPLVVMIHGFPDFWRTWLPLMETLADAYRVCAPDLRGYNLSDQPEGVEAYGYPHLVADVEAVIKAEGRTSAIIVAHDWGASIAWNMTFRRPELVDRLVIVSVPHPSGLARELAANEEQQRGSDYARKFQQEGSEARLNVDRLAFWVTDPEAKPHYLEAFGRSNFTAMMNYYRANYPKTVGGDVKIPQLPKIKPPLLVLHGMLDTALHHMGHAGVWAQTEQDSTLVFFPEAGHFVQQDAKDLFNRTVRDWLDARPVAAIDQT